jgi:citrate lyase subunit beta/citryl-CoA lyase
MRRPADLCRSWVFFNGAEAAGLEAAAGSGGDVLIQDLEDFTPPALRPRARELAAETYARWRQAGAVAAVRINPLDEDGKEDLKAVMRAKPDIVALPKASSPEQVVQLDERITRLEREYSIPQGSTRILPNIELVRGLVQTAAIARASQRVVGCLMAAEDLAADLGAERGRDGLELAYARQRFLIECIGAGTVAIDCPFTWTDEEGARADAQWARRLGYRAKAAVSLSHAAIINKAFTPSRAEIEKALKLVTAFEAARARGEARVEVDGSLVEVPIYNNARRLLARADRLAMARQ